MKWFEKFSESVAHHLGKKTMKYIAEDWEKVPTNSSKQSKEKRYSWLKIAMERLDENCDDEMKYRIMADTCPHNYPKTRIMKMRTQFKRLGSIDALIDLMKQDTSWGGGSFYDYPERIGNWIHITKVPYNPRGFREATTKEERRKAYCHCGLVKGSTEEISSTFCCCSGGWVQQLWEGILEQPVKVKLVESLLQGDDRCTHAIEIPINLSEGLS
ncbi:MAG: hypothetical protein JW779_06525 [Candidatus Thorarchaeota archaeon]|nr:hypothetical protein [Candidatus Thorarchaeota archaeon]